MILTVRDLSILKFIWNWKLVPTAIIWKRFFETQHDSYPYRRLLYLSNKGLIAQVYILNGIESGKVKPMRLWSLTSNGFKEIRESLGTCREVGYKSEYPRHDFLVSAIHLGEFVGNIPNEVKIFSENQLRRFTVNRFPSWVPTENCHRPDGYWCVGIGSAQKIYALEVEASVKTFQRYSQCATFYRRVTEIDRVFWYVDSLSEARSVQKALRIYDEARFHIHNFLLVSDFEKLGWNAAIVLGQDHSKSLKDFIAKEAGSLMEARWNLASIDDWMNPRICRVKSKSYYIPKNSKSANSICIYTPNSSSSNSSNQNLLIPPSINSQVSTQVPTDIENGENK